MIALATLSALVAGTASAATPEESCAAAVEMHRWGASVVAIRLMLSAEDLDPEFMTGCLMDHGLMPTEVAALVAAEEHDAESPSTGCGSDSDCKGTRICEDGRCVEHDPGQRTGEFDARRPVGLSKADALELHRARSLGYTGVGLAGGGVALGLLSVATNHTDSYVVGQVSGGGAIVAITSAATVGGLGSARARHLARAVGADVSPPVLPTLGWIGSIGSIGGGTYMLARALSGGDVETTAIAAVVSAGTLSTLALGLDAVAVSNDAERQVGSLSTRPSSTVSVAPFARVAGDRAMLGVAGSF